MTKRVIKIEPCTKSDLQAIDEMISEGTLINHHTGLRLRATIQELQEKLDNAKACIVDQDIGAKVEWQGKIHDLQAENGRLKGALGKIKTICNTEPRGVPDDVILGLIKEALKEKADGK